MLRLHIGFRRIRNILLYTSSVTPTACHLPLKGKAWIVRPSSSSITWNLSQNLSRSAHTNLGDYMLNSIWTNDCKLPEFPRLEKDLKTNVLIVGGGMAGILCAYWLQREGVDYALIEADRIMHGVSRNTTAKLTSQHGLVYHKLVRRFGTEIARDYWEVNEIALDRYRALAADCDFAEKDNYIYSDNLQELVEELAALEQAGIPGELVEKTGLPVDTAGAVHFKNQAQFHPLKFVRGIVKDLNIYENTRAKEFIGNRVLTDGGGITAGKIIIATHFPILNKHGGYYLKLYQQRSYVLALENAAQVDGMYLDAKENGLSFRNCGELLLLGGGGHRTGKQGGNWAELERFAARYYPQAREVCRWATQDCISLDGVPYIGQYSKATPNLFVATGFNKWGMTSSMVAAMILKDLVQGKENYYAPIFSPQRSVLRPQLLCNAVESAVNLLTPTRPRCPHLGCALKWNPQEHSWDCPCHGSRFNVDGKLLDNPATGNLKDR